MLERIIKHTGFPFFRENVRVADSGPGVLGLGDGKNRARSSDSGVDSLVARLEEQYPNEWNVPPSP